MVEKKPIGEDKQKDLQRKYLEMQMLAQQIKELQSQIQTIDTQLNDLEATNEALKEISATKQKTGMFVPISAGVFAKAELKDAGRLLVNVGAGTAVEKPVADVMKMIDDQASEIGRYKAQAMEQLDRLVAHARKQEEELRKLM